jgi:Helix-turn-helix of DDE superfamily endonuclease/DDE superfamily endonuclease
MLNIEKILCQDRLLRATTGLNRKAFEALVVKFGEVYHSFLQKRKKMRKRKNGGGRKARLTTIKEKLFYVLFYFKCYPTFDLASVLFEFDRSQAYRWIHRLQAILEKTLGEKKVLPLRKLSSIDEFIEHFPTVKEVIVDGTERPIQRPKNQQKQKDNYSGKKKRHTTKNLAAVAKNKQILVLSPSTIGKTHHKKIQDREDIIGGIPEEIPVLVDSGFQGVQKQFSNSSV